MLDFRHAIRSNLHDNSRRDIGAQISATTAIFTIVNAAIFQPLPYSNPDGYSEEFGGHIT